MISDREPDTSDKWEHARYVSWCISAPLYKRLRALHEWSITHVVGTPNSEQEFACHLLASEVGRCEKEIDAYEKSKQLIQLPENLIIER